MDTLYNIFIFMAKWFFTYATVYNFIRAGRILEKEENYDWLLWTSLGIMAFLARLLMEKVAYI